MNAHLLLYVLLALFSSSGLAKAASLSLVGWPYELSHTSVTEPHADPILSDMVCPSLTRLNLLIFENEPYLLKSIEVRPGTWSLRLKEGLKWWDGSLVTAEDVEQFVRQVLSKVSSASAIPEIRKFEFETQKTESSVEIIWKRDPEVGPYVLNNHPFYRVKAQSQGSVMCAGLWKINSSSAAMVLEPTQNLSGPTIQIASQSAEPIQPPFIRFRFGEEIHPSGYTRQIETVLNCDVKLDTNYVSLLAWNTRQGAAREVKFRNAMTAMIPRGAILRAGAGGLGDLISAPILRSHPGYKKTLLVPPYDPQKAENLLNSIGYKRAEDGFRRDPQGNAFELRVFVKDFDGSTLLRKVLDDSFRAMGIRVIFSNQKVGDYDAFLASIETSWPDGELSSLLLNKGTNNEFPFDLIDGDTLAFVRRYAQSLTSPKPDFHLLEKIHELIYSSEPFSILMQHRMCMDAKTASGRSPSFPSINQRNPEWFKTVFQEVAK